MYPHLPVSPLRLQVYGNGSAPLNEGLGEMVYLSRIPEDRYRMSELMPIEQKEQFLKAEVATFPIRNC